MFKQQVGGSHERDESDFEEELFSELKQPLDEKESDDNDDDRDGRDDADDGRGNDDEYANRRHSFADDAAPSRRNAGPANNKRKHTGGGRAEVSPAAKKRVARRLFVDEDDENTRPPTSVTMQQTGYDAESLKERPTQDQFVFGNDVVDLRQPLPGFDGAIVLLTNAFNTLMYIVAYKNTLLELKNRQLQIQLRSAENQLRKLENAGYMDVHVQLPRMYQTLFTMLDNVRNAIFVNHMRPLSCLLDRDHIKANVSFRSMEAKSKNDSEYIELMFNNPFRFIVVGCAKRTGQHDKNEVSPFPFFGDYIKNAINRMYDALYDLVAVEIKEAKRRLAADDAVNGTTPDVERRNASAAASGGGGNGGIGGLQTMEAFSNMKGSSGQKADLDRLAKYLREIKLPLAKRNNVEIIATSGNSGAKKASDAGSKMCYVTVDTSGKGCVKMVTTDVTEDAVYMSSYIRCRVLMVEEPAFSMQIYTKMAIKLLTYDDRVVKFADFANGGEAQTDDGQHPRT